MKKVDGNSKGGQATPEVTHRITDRVLQKDGSLIIHFSGSDGSKATRTISKNNLEALVTEFNKNPKAFKHAYLNTNVMQQLSQRIAPATVEEPSPREKAEALVQKSIDKRGSKSNNPDIQEKLLKGSAIESSDDAVEFLKSIFKDIDSGDEVKLAQAMTPVYSEIIGDENSSTESIQKAFAEALSNKDDKATKDLMKTFRTELGGIKKGETEEIAFLDSLFEKIKEDDLEKMMYLSTQYAFEKAKDAEDRNLKPEVINGKYESLVKKLRILNNFISRNLKASQETDGSEESPTTVENKPTKEEKLAVTSFANNDTSKKTILGFIEEATKLKTQTAAPENEKFHHFFESMMPHARDVLSKPKLTRQNLKTLLKDDSAKNQRDLYNFYKVEGPNIANAATKLKTKGYGQKIIDDAPGVTYRMIEKLYSRLSKVTKAAQQEHYLAEYLNNASLLKAVLR